MVDTFVSLAALRVQLLRVYYDMETASVSQKTGLPVACSGSPNTQVVRLASTKCLNRILPRRCLGQAQ